MREVAVAEGGAVVLVGLEDSDLVRAAHEANDVQERQLVGKLVLWVVVR